MTDRREFYRTDICSRTFIGIICVDGPHLRMLENRACDHDIPLGSALEILKLDNRHYYAICKDREPRIVLSRFADDDVDIVSQEFGIPIAGWRHARTFTESPAWTALKKWVNQHPDIARACSHTDTYVPGWYNMTANFDQTR